MTPKIEQIYQHRHGGFYIVEDVATHTTTKERLVIYSHLWPFEPSTWARPIAEWTEDRFREVTSSEYVDFIHHNNQEEFKQKILDSKQNSAKL